METKLINSLTLINNTKTMDIANLVNIKRSMAEKYKNFSSLPPLDKAVLIEDTFKIPTRAWADIKKLKDAE